MSAPAAPPTTAPLIAPSSPSPASTPITAPGGGALLRAVARAAAAVAVVRRGRDAAPDHGARQRSLHALAGGEADHRPDHRAVALRLLPRSRPIRPRAVGATASASVTTTVHVHFIDDLPGSP